MVVIGCYKYIKFQKGPYWINFKGVLQALKTQFCKVFLLVYYNYDFSFCHHTE